MKTVRPWSFVLVAALLPLPAALAADVGAPIVPKDHFPKEHWEIVYENVNRDLDGGRGAGSLEADALYVRFHTGLGQTATMDFDLGMYNASGADAALYAGIGLRYLVYDGEVWRAGAHLQVHYAPGIEQDRGAAELDYDLLEVDGGVTLAAKLKLDEQLTLMPYAGPVLSVLDLDGDIEVAGTRRNLDAEEDHVLGALVGIALVLPEQHTLRIEARVFDDVTISAAAGFVF